VIFAQRGFDYVVKSLFGPAGEDTPVTPAPTVDGLLHISHEHHGRGFGLCRGVAQQRQEILPLHGGSVLELVYHEVRVVSARFLEDERRVVAGDEPRQHVVYFGDVNDVLLFRHFGDLGLQVAQQCEVAVVLFEQGGTVDKPDVGVVSLGKFSKQFGELRCYRFNLCLFGRFGRAPPAVGDGVRHPFAVRGYLSAGYLGGVSGRTHPTVAEVAYVEAVFGCQVEYPAGRGHDGMFCPCGLCRRFGDDFAECLLAFVPAVASAFVLLLEEFSAEVQQFSADVPFPAVLYPVVHESGYPLPQRIVGCYLLYHPVRRTAEQGFHRKFEVEVEVDAEFPDEGTDDALEEFVDGQDGEVAVVVQYQAPYRGRPCPDIGCREAELPLQHGHVFLFIAAGEVVDFRQDTSLHLFRRLVGERDGEDVAVKRRFGDDIPHVFVCEVVGLARTGRCTDYFDVAHC